MTLYGILQGKMCSQEFMGSGRDEPIQVVIHMCIDAILGISLYSYLYLKLAKILCFSYYFICFPSNKIGEEGRTDSAWK
jgi:hypothetical protein